MTGGTPAQPSRPLLLLAGIVLVGCAVSLVLGLYGNLHTPTGGGYSFDSLVTMKVWLSSTAAVLALVQLATALRMYGRIGRGPAPRRAATVHRISGLAAVLLTVPVAYNCLYALGFADYSTRVFLHSLAGCALYGVFVTKMLALRVRAVPAAAVPVLGGTLFSVLAVVWLSSTAWYLAAR